MGALKGCFQCLRGLRVTINSREAHVWACRWITIAIILHNLIIDVEGTVDAASFMHVHNPAEVEDEILDGLEEAEEDQEMDHEGEEKRRKLTAELIVKQLVFNFSYINKVFVGTQGLSTKYFHAV